jgi:DNA-binding response OmpR family regulator
MEILVVEDDAISRLVLLTKLKKLGHEATPAQDGEEGWQIFLRDRPRLVITDWMMPELDGLQLCRRIRAHDSESYTYILVLTALTGKRNYLDGMDAGADDFLDKPVDMEELSARLHVASRILALQTHVRQLEGLLPICSYCKKIRVTDDEWQVIEGYITAKTGARFSHGYCPECYERIVRPQFDGLTQKEQS